MRTYCKTIRCLRTSALSLTMVTVLLSSHLSHSFAQSANKTKRPNIIIMLADDMGYSDLGCYGSEIHTPNLDSLAQHGARFTQFYNTGRCCPTRAALLTGLYQHQAGIGHMVGDHGLPSYQGYLNNHCVTIAEALQPAGYQTLMSGKWHVGSAADKWPRQRGFQRYFGCPTGGGFYFAETMRWRGRSLALDDAETPFPEEEYVTDLFTDYAIQFVKKAHESDSPFFLYFAHIAPHWPLQAKPQDIEKYRDRYSAGWNVIRNARFEKQKQLGLISEPWSLSEVDSQAASWDELTDDQRLESAHRMAVYAAQVDSIDQNLGRLIEVLKQQNEWDNTIIFFLSDNGCSAEGDSLGFRRDQHDTPVGGPESYASAGLEWANVCNTPLRKFKMFAHEGGIASPLIVHWPNGLNGSNRLIHSPAHVIDLMPTCLDLAGAAYPQMRNNVQVTPLPGKSLLPRLQGENADNVRSTPLFWEHQGNKAIRYGDWKLVSQHRGNWELYDLKSDRTETQDLSQEFPEQVIELSKQWQAWADLAGVAEWPIK